jgi:hypothetical protein
MLNNSEEYFLNTEVKCSHLTWRSVRFLFIYHTKVISNYYFSLYYHPTKWGKEERITTGEKAVQCSVTFQIWQKLRNKITQKIVWHEVHFTAGERSFYSRNTGLRSEYINIHIFQYTFSTFTQHWLVQILFFKVKISGIRGSVSLNDCIPIIFLCEILNCLMMTF